MRRGAQERVALGVIVGGFAIGCFTHAMDFWWFGWAPYRFGPPVANAFWNSLVVLDAAVIVLLARGRRRAGLVLACAVMLGDVAANSYAWGVLGLSAFAPALVAQTGFLGFLLGSVGFLWRRDRPASQNPAVRPELVEGRVPGTPFDKLGANGQGRAHADQDER